jgi:endoglycosylceramidase
VVQSLAAQRIWMLFDFHQDLLGPIYGGEGVPEWGVESVRGPSTDLLGPPLFGFPFRR